MKKMIYKLFEKILIDNSKENPFNISDYDKQSVLDCRLNSKDHLNFYIEFICLECNKKANKNLARKYHCNLENISYCSSCRRKQAILKKYGKEYFVQTEEFKEKSKKTNLEKYGKEYFVQTDEFKDKSRKTCLKKFNCDNVFQNEDIKQKIKESIKEKYGKDYYSQTDDFKKKSKQSLINHFGVDSPIKSPEIKQKIEKTILDKYGVKHAMQAEEVKEKFIATNNEKYGVDYPQQSLDIQNKTRKTKIDKYGNMHGSCKYAFKDQKFDSSWELAFYIYHIDKGHDIKHEPTYFTYECDNKLHRYYPDFKVSNRYYEIKGEQFIRRNKRGKIINLVNFGEETKECSKKYKCMIKHNVIIIDYNKIQKYLEYTKTNYGESYLESFKSNS